MKHNVGGRPRYVAATAHEVESGLKNTTIFKSASIEIMNGWLIFTTYYFKHANKCVVLFLMYMNSANKFVLKRDLRIVGVRRAGGTLAQNHSHAQLKLKSRLPPCMFYCVVA